HDFLRAWVLCVVPQGGLVMGRYAVGCLRSRDEQRKAQRAEVRRLALCSALPGRSGSWKDGGGMSSDYSLYRELVTQLMQGQESLPSLPSLTLQIRTALQAPDTTSTQLERLISRDPALSALLVKHASSALY